MLLYKKLFLMLSLGTFLSYIGLVGCAGPSQAPESTLTSNIGTNEVDPAVWGKYYPREYESSLKTKEETKTEFGGSVRFSQLDRRPYLRTLYKGYGFGEDYNEERGHYWALNDVREIKRLTKKTTASCLNCKSSAAAMGVQKEGISWYKRPFSEVNKHVKFGISCWDCHDPKTMALRVTRPNMISAFKRMGKDVNASPRNEMRTYVCAQCHNEYYIDKKTKEVINPWDNGLTAQSEKKFYDKVKHFDWTHPQSGTNLIKPNHPEYEMSDGGVHQTAGVSCSDCHLPYIREGVEKYSSHWMTSPLKNLEVSCQPCHRQTTQWLKDRIHDIQTKTNELENIGAQENLRAITAIETAAKNPNANKAKIEEARRLHQDGQFYWDWVFAENSMGFHNPQKAMYTLGIGINSAREAQIAASQAIGTPINPNPITLPKQQRPMGQGPLPGDKPKVPKRP